MQKFPRLEEETRPAVGTEQCAFYLGRRPQTARGWACYGDGPLQPIRVHGRLLWRVSDIKRALGLEAA